VSEEAVACLTSRYVIYVSHVRCVAYVACFTRGLAWPWPPPACKTLCYIKLYTLFKTTPTRHSSL